MKPYGAEKDRETAKVILETLDSSIAPINVDWAMEEKYLSAIMAGLRKARRNGRKL